MVWEMQLVMGRVPVLLPLAGSCPKCGHIILCLILFAINWNACMYTYTHVHMYMCKCNNCKDIKAYTHTMPNIIAPYCGFQPISTCTHVLVVIRVLSVYAIFNLSYQYRHAIFTND